MSASNGAMKCQAPGCLSPQFRGGEREQMGHATDAQGKTYHFRCFWRMVMAAAARPTA